MDVCVRACVCVSIKRNKEANLHVDCAMKKTKKSEEMGRRKREWGRGGERGGRGDIEEKQHTKKTAIATTT